MTNPKAKSLAEDILATGSLTPTVARSFDEDVLHGKHNHTPVVINNHYIGYYTGETKIDVGIHTSFPYVRHEIFFGGFVPRDRYANALGVNSRCYPPTANFIIELETRNWTLLQGLDDDTVTGHISDFNDS